MGNIRDPREAGRAAGKTSDSVRKEEVSALRKKLFLLEQENRNFERSLNHLQEVVSDYVDRYDYLPIGCCTLDSRGVILEINIAAAKLLGWERARNEGSGFLTFVPTGHSNRFIHHLQQCIATNARVSTELRVGRSHSTTPVQLVSVPVRDPRRGTTVYRTVLIDITDRLQWDSVLQESDQRYRDLVELLPGAVFILCEGVFVFVNPATVELFAARRAEELLGRSILDFVHADSVREIEACMLEVESGGMRLPRTEQKFVRLDGSLVDVDVTAGAFSFKGKPATQIIVRDISQRKRAEALLLQAEERFSKAFDASPVAISIAALAGDRFIDVNDAFLDLFSFRREEVVGHTVEEIGIHTKPDARRKIVERLKKEHSISNFEIKLRTKPGKFIHVIESLELIELEKEQCVLTLWEDITDRRRLEKEILDITEREQSRVGQDLHDGICQDLAGIAFLAEGLASNLAAGRQTPSQLSADAASIAKHTKRAIDDAHGLATGLYPVRVEDNGLNSALEELASDTASRYQISCVFKSGDSIVVRDNSKATHVYRIVQEAVSNAVKHGEAKSVVIALTEKDQMIRLSIEDDGKGFRPTLKRPGMGLRTMQYRARIISGALEIRGGPAKGTVVRLDFQNDNSSYEGKTSPNE